MKRTVENLRYLLWSQKGLSHSKWVEQLANWAKCDLTRATELLKKGNPNFDEQKNIADSVGRPEADIQYTRLLDEDRVEVLKENVQYLLNSMEHGEGNRLADFLKVSADTISEWKKWRRKKGIDKKNQEALCRYFGLQRGIDLERDPLFLSLSEVGDQRRKKWLHDRIEALETDTLNELFPALERILK